MRGGRQEPYCCDCGIDTIAIDEIYMVDNGVWQQAWPEGLPRGNDLLGGDPAQLFLPLVLPGRELAELNILCVDCLEKRIGRTLCTDFIDAPINDPNRHQHSDRLRDRLLRPF